MRKVLKTFRTTVALGVSMSIFLSMSMASFAADTMRENLEQKSEVTKETNQEQKYNFWEGSIVEGNRIYWNEKGKKSTGLIEIENRRYFFNEEGVLQTGWQTVGDVTYYFSLSTGIRYENCVEVIDGITYSFNKSGYAEVLKIEDSAIDEGESNQGETIDIGSKLEENVGTEEEKDWELQESEKRTSGWQNTEEGKIYIDEEGKRLTGMQNLENKLYYFNENGILQIGWINLEDESYFAAMDGVLYCNQRIWFGQNSYYMGNDGSVQKGIVEITGVLYYASEKDGKIQQTAGWINVSGKRYFASESGVLYRNQLIWFGKTAYCMGTDGKNSILYGG